MAEKTFPIPGYANLQEFTQKVLQKVVQATQHGNSLIPLLDEYQYWNSFQNFQEFTSEEGVRIVNDIGDLLRHNGVQCGWLSGSSKSKSISADLEERFDRIVDANDIMLEAVGNLLDEAAGIKKNDIPILPPSLKQSSPVISTWNKNNKSNKSATFKLLMAKNIQRPQMKWIDKIDNSNTPFIPYIRSKPNAIINSANDDVLENDSQGFLSARHPYSYELSQFEPNDWQTEEKEPIDFKVLDDTPLTFVEDEESLDSMLQKLKSSREIAIDLEHHSYRSFQGFVCLMQLSTRNEDFIVDTLKLRDELYILNEVFTDPNILKVLHGADSDIGWLMRDFGLYIVNMFDTGQASRVLHEERYSLAHLLNKYCAVSAQKQFQLADWRIRPIPKEMVMYAREDTHYLLYVYDILRNRLIQRGNDTNNLLRSVYSKSTAICSTLYVKPVIYADSYIEAANKYRGNLNPQQMECYRLLFEWRDKVAREEDESYGYILPNHMLFQIAENLPKEPPGVIACCNPVPPLIKQHLMDIHRMVIDARLFDGQIKSLSTAGSSSSQDSLKNTINKSSLSRVSSTKSGFDLYKISGPLIQQKKPSLTIFEQMVKEKVEMTAGKKKAIEIIKLLRSPFEMYLPNKGMEAVQPETINQSWKDASRTQIELNQQKEKKSEKKSEKKRTLEDELSLREMLPKKKKKKKNNDERDTPSPTQTPGNKTKNKNKTSFLKDDLQKFSLPKDESSDSNMNKIEEPKFGGVVRTKVHSKSGSRSMTYK